MRITTLTTLLIYLITICDGQYRSTHPNPQQHTCNIQPCFTIFNNLRSLFTTTTTTITSQQLECILRHNLTECMKTEERSCRGDLNYHSLNGLVNHLKRSYKEEEENCIDNGFNNFLSGDSEEEDESNRDTHTTTTTTNNNHCNNNNNPQQVSCSLFAFTHFKPFHANINSTSICQLTGSWSLIDTPEFNVQVTNSYAAVVPVIVTTTLITILIKESPCQPQRKFYQATYEEVPSMFTDGSSKTTSIIIQQIVASEHVKINILSSATIIDIVKVTTVKNKNHPQLNSLSITIILPHENLTNLYKTPSKINGLPICFYGCVGDNKPTTNCDAEDMITMTTCNSMQTMQSLLNNTVTMEMRLYYPGDEFSGNLFSTNCCCCFGLKFNVFSSIIIFNLFVF